MQFFAKRTRRVKTLTKSAQRPTGVPVGATEGSTFRCEGGKRLNKIKNLYDIFCKFVICGGFAPTPPVLLLV